MKQLQLILQIKGNVGWFHVFDRGLPLIEVREEPLGYGNAAPRCLRRISLLLQMFFELDEPVRIGRPFG